MGESRAVFILLHIVGEGDPEGVEGASGGRSASGANRPPDGQGTLPPPALRATSPTSWARVGMLRAKPLTFKRARALRRKPSLPEVVLWRELRGWRARGLAFRRQHPIGAYILDFYCTAARLAVEVDGEAHGHADQRRHDERRAQWLGGTGDTGDPIRGP